MLAIYIERRKSEKGKEKEKETQARILPL